jgi:C4-dicarboxylate-binding protein DctP
MSCSTVAKYLRCVSKAATDTWIAWIEQMEAAGHPGKATASLYARFIKEAGGRLPDGVAQYLGM